MKYSRKWLYVLLAALFALLGACTAYASSEEKLRSVTIHVKSRVEAGDVLYRDDIVFEEPERGEIGVWVDSDKYSLDSAKIVEGSSRDLTVGQEIKLKLVLSITDDDYIFKSGFGRSNVKLSGSATTVAEVRRSAKRLTVTVRLRGIKGNYDSPADAEWSRNERGKAGWSSAEDGSGYYELLLKRGGSIIKRVYDYSGRSYNFYPYMTKAGRYEFRVRTVPHTEEEKCYGKNSEWVESDSLYIESWEVSDGSGAVWEDEHGNAGPSAGQVGWYQTNGMWHYRYPNGVEKRNGWELIQGLWYYFDGNGSMQIGWLKSGMGWYYLGPDGAMRVGWQDINGSWYYLEEDSGKHYGLMAAETLVVRDGKVYYVDKDGRQLRGWQQAGGYWSYFDPTSGEMVRDRVIDTFYVDEDGIWRQ